MTVDSEDGIEENRYEITYSVNLVEIDENAAIMHDKDLNIYFQEESRIRYLYEVETNDVKITLAEPVKKSEDFNRRLFYRLDWIQVCMEASGKGVSVGKISEMREAWKELKESILEDYRGKVVMNKLEAIDKDFEDGKAIAIPITQYLHFGLLFPNIPKKHRNEWNRTRKVSFSEYENEQFEEYTVYAGTNSDTRNYSVTGKTLPDSKTELLEFTGEIKMPVNDLFPVSTVISFACNRGKTGLKWHIKFDKITNL
jgi:hypothetical protein